MSDLELEFADDGDAVENAHVLADKLHEVGDDIEDAEFSSALATLQEVQEMCTALVNYIQAKENSNG